MVPATVDFPATVRFIKVDQFRSLTVMADHCLVSYYNGCHRSKCCSTTHGVRIYELRLSDSFWELRSGKADSLLIISTTNGDTPARATLKLVYAPASPDDEDESDFDSEDEEAMKMQRLLGAAPDSDDGVEESSSDDEDMNGGPSDPAKSKKARKEAAAAKMLKTLKQEGSDEDMEDLSSSPVVNGLSSKKSKGKAKATLSDDEESSDEEGDDEAGDL